MSTELSMACLHVSYFLSTTRKIRQGPQTNVKEMQLTNLRIAVISL